MLWHLYKWWACVLQCRKRDHIMADWDHSMTMCCEIHSVWVFDTMYSSGGASLTSGIWGYAIIYSLPAGAFCCTASNPVEILRGPWFRVCLQCRMHGFNCKSSNTCIIVYVYLYSILLPVSTYICSKYLNVRIKEYAMRYAGIYNILHSIALTSRRHILKNQLGLRTFKGFPGSRSQSVSCTL